MKSVYLTEGTHKILKNHVKETGGKIQAFVDRAVLAALDRPLKNVVIKKRSNGK